MCACARASDEKIAGEKAVMGECVQGSECTTYLFFSWLSHSHESETGIALGAKYV